VFRQEEEPVGTMVAGRLIHRAAYNEANGGFWVAMEIQLPLPISRILFRGCSEQTQAGLLSRMQIREGAMLSDKLLQQARQAAKAYNERLGVLVRLSLRREEFSKSPPEIRKTFTRLPSDDGVNVLIVDPASFNDPATFLRIRVDGSQQKTQLIEAIMPVDPRRGGETETGVVKLAIVVGKDGTVIDVDRLAGPESLISAATDAVRRWRYRPTLLNGRPVEVETTVDVGFPQDK
jgi:hypothetical protein